MCKIKSLLFQCNRISANDVVEDMRAYLSGQFQRVRGGRRDTGFGQQPPLNGFSSSGKKWVELNSPHSSRRRLYIGICFVTGSYFIVSISSPFERYVITWQKRNRRPKPQARWDKRSGLKSFKKVCLQPDSAVDPRHTRMTDRSALTAASISNETW